MGPHPLILWQADSDAPKFKPLPEGARVEVRHLISQAGFAMNGQHGHVERWHTATGRYDIRLEQIDRLVSCRPDNVRLVTHTMSGRRVG